MAAGLSQRDIDMAQIRAEIEAICQKQAQDFIDETLLRRDEEIKLDYENRYNPQRVLNEPVQRLVIPNMEMRDESDFKLGSAANDSMIQTPTTPQMMGTRRKPKDFGR